LGARGTGICDAVGVGDGLGLSVGADDGLVACAITAGARVAHDCLSINSSARFAFADDESTAGVDADAGSV